MNIIRLSVLVCSFLVTAAAFSEEDEQKDVLFLSTPEQIATLNAEPDRLIGGLVNPLSGQPALRQIDLIAKGAQDIILSRSYIAPYIPCSFPIYKRHQNDYDRRHLYYHLSGTYKGWQFYPHLKLILNNYSKEVRFSDPNGSTLDFSMTGLNMESRLASSPYAMSNTAGDVPSGLYDLRNTRAFSEENGRRIVVHAPDGTIRYYVQKAQITLASYLYLLQKEILPNGKVLKYHYDNDQLAAIESKDPKERVTYASIHISGNPWKNSCHFTSSSGTTADYSYQRRPIHWKIKEKKKKMKFEEEHRGASPPLLTSVSSPSYRHESLSYCDKYLLNSYSGKNDTFIPLCAGFGGGVGHFRIHQLLLPVAQNNAMRIVHEMSYQPPIAGQKEGLTKEYILKLENLTKMAIQFEMLISLIITGLILTRIHTSISIMRIQVEEPLLEVILNHCPSGGTNESKRLTNIR